MRKVICSFLALVLIIYLAGSINANNRKVLTKEVKPNLITVTVTGEVLAPGDYKVLEGTKVSFILNMAKKTELSVVLDDEELILKPCTINVRKRTGFLNLSKATKDELLTLPGIGPVGAKKILEKQQLIFYNDWKAFRKDLRLSEENLLNIMCLTVLC